jgi:hypothetical protein
MFRFAASDPKRSKALYNSTAVEPSLLWLPLLL